MKVAVLGEVEGVIGEDAVLASNTSTIPISLLAKGLEAPAEFLRRYALQPGAPHATGGIIRGEQTSDETINRVVGHAPPPWAESPVVVNDCPGFFVNRVLFPLLLRLQQLVADGADFAAVDKVMEKSLAGPWAPPTCWMWSASTPAAMPVTSWRRLPARMSREGHYRHRRDVRRQPLRSEEQQGGFYATMSRTRRAKPKKVADAASYDRWHPSKPKQDFRQGTPSSPA